MKLLPLTLFTSMLLALSPTEIVLADDGEMLRRDISKTPEFDSEHAAIRMLPLYVPAQKSDGTLLSTTTEGGVEYWTVDGELIETREYARPLISHYTDGHVEGIDEEGYGGFPGHGNRDAWGAVSLDDGETWKRTNLSRSGDQSSIRIKLGGRQKLDYPGDVGRSFAASDGNKVLIVWVSRYATGGNPTYAIPIDTGELAQLADLLLDRGRIDNVAECIDGEDDGGLLTPCLYLEDHFGVAGSQGVSDLADEDLPLIGQLPYAAVWAARGVILPPTAVDEPSRFVWFKAERLSSAVRDANRPEAACVKGAGCVVTWQEDPDGIRPGHGDGPGEGWSGAIAHHQTDTWYSYIDWDDFGLVADDTLDTVTYGSLYDGTGDLTAWSLANDEGGSPRAAIPMAIPVRLTDNAMCVAEEEDDSDSKIYCHVDFGGVEGVADFCDHTVPVVIETPNEASQTIEMCVTEDGRLMRGNTASTRPRLGLHGYSTLGDYREGSPIDSAWFYMAYEENKGLGDICDDGDCPEEEMTDADKRDMGKNIWYHTFDMFHPELVSQGLMLNQPAVYPDEWENPLDSLIVEAPLSGYNFYAFGEDPIYFTQAGIETTTLYQTEIARRSSPISQDWYDAGVTGTVAVQLWKAGIIRRGGPADIFGRRFVLPDSFNGTTTYEWCTDTYNLYTETYQLCTDTYSLCTTTHEVWGNIYEWCTTGCVDNPDYDYNRGQCRKDPTQSRCLPYLDENDVPTDVCESVPSCSVLGLGDWCDVGDEGCQVIDTELISDLLDSCPASPEPYQFCVDETSCFADDSGSCPDDHAQNQYCEVTGASCVADTGVCPDDITEDQYCEWIGDILEDDASGCPNDIATNQHCEVTDTSCVDPDEDACPDDTAVNPYCNEVNTGEGFDPTVNPYDYANMECLNESGGSAWHFTDGLNPRYVKGLCAAPAINLSATTILTGEASYCTDAVTCFEAFPFNNYFDDLNMVDSVGPISKILTWQQFGPDYGGDETIDDPYENGDDTNLNDMSWENPYDVAKGHRGFMAGDMVMVMYAASPNWKALTDAHAIFNLYNRRSFDGGQTWTTLPGGWTHTNDETYSGLGTRTCEWMVEDAVAGDEVPVCTDYIAGAFEQARNVSQLTGIQVTVLDPRYAPTARSITPESVSNITLDMEPDPLPLIFDAPEYEDDTRDPSRYFMVYETGHSSAYDAGEAAPLDLFYSRAIEWGDQYLVYQDEDTYLGNCLPAADPDDDYEDGVLAGFCNEFDALEGKNFLESGEASITANPGGRFLFSIWNEEELDGEEVIGSDAMFRRVLFQADYVPLEYDDTQ